MKVKTVTCKRVRNLGNYESETFEMTAELDDKDDAIAVAEILESFVHYMLGIDERTARKIFEERKAAGKINF